MGSKHAKQGPISEVFRLLGLKTARERERFRLLPHLGRVGKEAGVSRYEPADTRNNTAKDEEHAQLEPTP